MAGIRVPRLRISTANLQTPALDEHSLYYRVDGLEVGTYLTGLHWSSVEPAYTAEIIEHGANEYSKLELLLDQYYPTR